MKKANNCFDSKQNKNYKRWKKFIQKLADKKNDKEIDKKEKTKTFEDLFLTSIISKYYINQMNYQPFMEGA